MDHIANNCLIQYKIQWACSYLRLSCIAYILHAVKMILEINSSKVCIFWDSLLFFWDSIFWDSHHHFISLIVLHFVYKIIMADILLNLYAVHQYQLKV